jgi:8-oxo-dGTP pyrophosphatase MutT (NUDIX family)
MERPAGYAVLVALTDWEPRKVLLTLRAQTLRQHPGEVSFPGGKIESGETPAQAALREACEEVGLSGAAVQVTGCLPAVQGRNGERIVPVIGRLPSPVALHPSQEVAEIFWAELASLRWEGAPRFPEFRVGAQRVWGLTAHILWAVLQRWPAAGDGGAEAPL